MLYGVSWRTRGFPSIAPLFFLLVVRMPMMDKDGSTSTTSSPQHEQSWRPTCLFQLADDGDAQATYSGLHINSIGDLGNPAGVPWSYVDHHFRGC